MGDVIALVDFRDSLKHSSPPSDLSPLLTALWWAGKGEWEHAHDCVAVLSGANAAWVHAYLHRWEGDLSNAAYWYRSAGKEMPREEFDLDAEWLTIAQALLEPQG
ncbi:hypothetical protein GCM10007160_08820 [Litchfieldella qijiaojingensis]|uniref:Uncharacterized protein n=1 Tax=Litchfieldella qijiaojingensis TaxID=980347 RepID=A0ABQ2YI77_9GAMM|nr:hypothetical protein [Halomonas qijiaojingensis]GGX83809.1 hypothetical protein GCM10007160_08820 [Halomonas qijiaojingensis]